MKLHLVMCSEQWEGSYTIKVFRNKSKAANLANKLQQEEDENEYPSYHYYVKEIEADLDEWEVDA